MLVLPQAFLGLAERIHRPTDSTCDETNPTRGGSSEDDHNWPEPDRVGRQELEVKLGKEHISFTVRITRIGLMSGSGGCASWEGSAVASLPPNVPLTTSIQFTTYKPKGERYVCVFKHTSWCIQEL